MSLRCDSTIAADVDARQLELLDQLAEVAERGQRQRSFRARAGAGRLAGRLGRRLAAPWWRSFSPSFEPSSPWSSPPWWLGLNPRRCAALYARAAFPALADGERLVDAGAERAGLRAGRLGCAPAHAQGRLGERRSSALRARVAARPVPARCDCGKRERGARGSGFARRAAEHRLVQLRQRLVEIVGELAQLGNGLAARGQTEVERAAVALHGEVERHPVGRDRHRIEREHARAGDVERRPAGPARSR